VTFAGLAGYVAEQVAKEPADRRQSPHMRSDYSVEPVLIKRAMLSVAPAGRGGDFTEIADAVNRAPLRALIKIRPGEYQKPVCLRIPVHLIGEGRREDIVLRPDPVTGTCISVDPIYQHHGTTLIKNLTLRGGASTSGSLVDLHKCGPVRVEDCDLISQEANGVMISGSSPVAIRNCRLRRKGAVAADPDSFFSPPVGVSVGPGANAEIEDCEIIGYGAGVHISRGTIKAWPGFLKPLRPGLLINRCRIHRNAVGVQVGKNCAARVEGCDLTGNTTAFRIDAGGEVARKDNKE
jgi:hypothetical protein